MAPLNSLHPRRGTPSASDEGDFPLAQVTNRAARAYCSFDGRTEVTEEDVGKVGGSLSTWRT